MNDKVVLNDTNATWKLCYDNLGQAEITSKIAVNSDSGVLSNGENVFYILVASADGMQKKVYTLTIYRKISVTVEYYGLNNDVINTFKMDNNKTISSPYRYNPTGYTVNNWYYYEGSEKTNFVFGENGTIVTNKTVLKLYPEATANTYDVTLSVGSDESVSESTVTVTYDSSKTFPIAQKTGYSFVGWYNVGTQVTNADGYCDNWGYARQVTLTPRWSINKYTLTLDESTEGGSATGEGKYNYNSEVTVTAKAYTGYTFTGWYDGETKLSAELSYTFAMPAENKTYTAKYEKCTSHTYDDCVCTKCGTVTHTPNDDCICSTCSAVAHTPNDNCICTKCGAEVHGLSASGYCRHGNVIYFGTHPQSEVTDSTLKSTLTTKAGTLPTSSNSRSWTSYGYYVNGNVSNYMWYVDVENAGEKYRGVYFTGYRPYGPAYSSTLDFTRQDDNGYNTNTVYWFKYEPIKWQILTESNGKAFLLCDVAIDCREISREYNDYAESTIRSWLNDTFYNIAFTDIQKALIQTTTVDNSVSSTGYSSNSYVCENTSDKVFLLSYAEVKTYLTSDEARMFNSSDYAKSQGICEGLGTCLWWLRSPYNEPGTTRYIDNEGKFKLSGVSCTYNGIVPALWIDIK